MDVGGVAASGALSVSRTESGSMRKPLMVSRMIRASKMLVPGAILLQAGGCSLAALNDLLQTVLLGITAAGSIAILQNI